MWTPEEPISKLEKKIKEQYRAIAEILYSELHHNKLEVELSPAPDPQFIEHFIRIAVNHPPHWFRELYHQYKHGISRKQSLEALNRIRNYEDKETKSNKYIYDALFREFIQEKSEEYIRLDKEHKEKFGEYDEYENNLKFSKYGLKDDYPFKELEGEVPF